MSKLPRLGQGKVVHVRRLSSFIAARYAAVRNRAAVRRAVLLFWVDNAVFKITARIARQRAWLYFVTVIAAIGASVLVLPTIGEILGPLITGAGGNQSDKLAIFRSLVGTIGGALVGATAIAFSVVMLAVQINFARMPYGLFRRLSSDLRLLASFATTFFLALLVSSTALVPDRYYAEGSLVAFWGCILSLVFFLVAYRRALSIINPIFQLSLLVQSAIGDLRWWSRRASRYKHFVTPPKEPGTHEVARVVFFETHPSWLAVAKRSVAHAISFARSYSTLGDHEVSRVALQGIVQINAGYVSAKGKTFFQTHILGSNQFASDGFINETLELLRQHVREVLSRKDETAVEQACDAMAGLTAVYCQIDYGNQYKRSKDHAKLAVGYLAQAVESVVPHDMPDVLMHGARLLGRTTLILVATGEPIDALVATEKLTALSAVGVGNQKFLPVTQTTVTQLSLVLRALLTSSSNDVDYAAREVSQSIEFVAKFIVSNVKDTPLTSAHSSNLQSYYGLTVEGTFAYWLAEVANRLLEVEKNDQEARRLVEHISDWSEELSKGQRELFRLAVEKHSFLANDLVQWISHVARSLMVVAQSPACHDHTRQELHDHSHNLVYVFTAIPDEKGAVDFIAGFHLVEALFEIGDDAITREVTEVSNAVRDVLLFWAIERGHHRVGWPIVEDAVAALAVLAVKQDGDERLKAEVAAKIGAAPMIAAETKLSVAKGLHELADEFARDRYPHSRVIRAMQSVDQTRMWELLTALSTILTEAASSRPART
jgi:hypothetical protein